MFDKCTHRSQCPKKADCVDGYCTCDHGMPPSDNKKTCHREYRNTTYTLHHRDCDDMLIKMRQRDIVYDSTIIIAGIRLNTTVVMFCGVNMIESYLRCWVILPKTPHFDGVTEI